MSLNDLKISKKLAVGFAVVVTVVAVMCASVFMSLASIKTAVAQNDSEVAQLNASGEIISGHCVNTPRLREDGILTLREQWERYGPHTASGVDYLEEVA